MFISSTLFDIVTSSISLLFIVVVTSKFNVNNVGNVVQFTICCFFDTPFTFKSKVTDVPLVNEFIVPFTSQSIDGFIVLPPL